MRSNTSSLRATLTGACALAVLTACSSTQVDIDDAQFVAAAPALRLEVSSGQEAVAAPISLYEAMARALKYNLDHRVTMMEADLAARDYDLSRYDQLPKVVAQGGYYGRSNEAGASSLSLLSGRQSLEPSTSTDRDVFSGDLTASFNILDFGLARIRTDQLSDEARIAEERRRKAVISIMEDVHRAYHRAVSAERLSARLETLDADARAAFTASRSQYESRRTAPMPALSYQRELTEIRGQALALRRELATAKMELAALMGLSPEKRFVLSVPASVTAPPAVAMPIEEMMDIALAQRPEVRENAYVQRIAEADIRKAAWEAFPSLEGFAGVNASSNDFLFNNDWAAYGVRASWNLLEVFKTPAKKKRARARLAVERERGLATAMAVMTQVAVARHRYTSLLEEYATADQGARVQTDILTQVTAQSQRRATSTQTLVREQMNAILSEARRDALHADMREASAQIYTAMGYDPYGADVSGDEDVATLAASLRTLWTQRERAPGT